MIPQGPLHATDLLSRLLRCETFAAEIAFFFALSMMPFAALKGMAAVSWLPARLEAPLASASRQGNSVIPRSV
jgi:uncharacterized BrkB/YihY/UPF0761 family membrane protein